MSRIRERQNAVTVLYTHLVRNQSIEEVLEDNAFVSEIGSFIPPMELSDEMLEALNRAADRKEVYIPAINHYLKKGWNFDRLGFLEQSVLLFACSELELGYQDKNIVLNEAVRLAKEFGEEDSYRLINGVLDAI